MWGIVVAVVFCGDFVKSRGYFDFSYTPPSAPEQHLVITGILKVCQNLKVR